MRWKVIISYNKRKAVICYQAACYKGVWENRVITPCIFSRKSLEKGQ